jgi:hypothetical protein
MTVSVNDMTMEHPAWESAIRKIHVGQRARETRTVRLTLTEEEMADAQREWQERDAEKWVAIRRQHNVEELQELTAWIGEWAPMENNRRRSHIKRWQIRLMVSRICELTDILSQEPEWSVRETGERGWP